MSTKHGKEYYFIKFSQVEDQKYQGHWNNVRLNAESDW